MNSNISLKLDIHEAFDTLDWNFLLGVLTTFGFNPRHCNWVHVILKSYMFSILVTWHPTNKFASMCGVFQGDLVSLRLTRMWSDYR